MPVEEQIPVSTKEQWRGLNHMAEIREIILPVWFGKGWSAQEPKPHLFRTLVRSIPPTKGRNQITYALDCVDYMSEKPPDDTVPAFEKSGPKLREMLRISLANVLDVSLDRIRYVKRSVLWCGVSE